MSVAKKWLQGKKFCAGWRGKISNLIRDTILDRFFSRKPKIIVVKVRPRLCRHIDVLPENGLGILIEKNGAFGEGLNRAGIRCLSGSLGSMNHEGCVSACLA